MHSWIYVSMWAWLPLLVKSGAAHKIPKYIYKCENRYFALPIGGADGEIGRQGLKYNKHISLSPAHFVTISQRAQFFVSVHVNYFDAIISFYSIPILSHSECNRFQSNNMNLK